MSRGVGRTWVRAVRVVDYDLGSTLDSGQAFRWEWRRGGWEGVVRGRWVRLEPGDGAGFRACTVVDPGDWGWLLDYLAVDVDPAEIGRSLPGDPGLMPAVEECRGLRLLRQEPWECLASFILSSTKQIVQIRRVVGELCRRFGGPVECPAESGPVWSFPPVERIAGLEERDLRACGMGFRAPYLLGTARRVASGQVDLERLRKRTMGEARGELMSLPGVGRKIADCVLLFSCGFDAAFPVDVWILRVLGEIYFPGRRPATSEVVAFAESHFGPFGGYAQQYLFHWARRRAGRVANPGGDGAGC